jgi:hypothetical protein
LSAALSSKLTEPPPGSGGPAEMEPASTSRPVLSAQGWRIVAAMVVVSLVAISGRSLWIDEACTAIRAMQPTLPGWWHAMEHEKTGCLQMPFYMLYTWAWARVFGWSEWSLHFANWPWFIAGAAAFALSFPAGDRRRWMAGCLVLLCPFAWYYLDEARPYAMQLGVTLLAIAALRQLAQRSGSGEASCAGPLGLFLAALLVLCGSSLFGVIWAGAAAAALVLLLPGKQLVGLFKKCSWMWLAAAVPLAGLAVYYAWTLKQGARGSATATTTMGTVLFDAYELLGFSGLGPGRLEMRNASLDVLRGYWPWVALYALALVIIIGAALLLAVRNWSPKQMAIALCCCAPPAMILGAGWVLHFRVLGRHLTPLVPALWMLLTLGAAALWSRSSGWGRVPVVVFCALSLGSCLSLRFASRHEKDNYRAAAAVAKETLHGGKPVWWSAAEEGAIYYGLPVSTNAVGTSAARFVVNQPATWFSQWPSPAVIIASKPDVYDGELALEEYVRQKGYHEAQRFQAFVVWERSGQP